jgi:hypothetical protein
MSAAVAARAFEPFYTTKDVGKGSGLGLSTVYGFARQSGGGATLTSAPGEGTRVAFYLPVISAPLEHPIENVPAGPLQGGAGLILVVEDDDAVREVSSGAALAGQAQALRPGLRVLLTTGYARRDGSETDKFPVIAKPFRSAELSAAVARLMNSMP